MTVEELEIIIRAKIDDAIDGIKQITKEVKQAVNKSIAPMQELTTKTKEMANKSASSVDKAKSEIKKYEKTVRDTAKNIKINFSAFNFDDNSTIEQLKAKMQGLKAVREQIYKQNPNGLFSEMSEKQLDEIFFKLFEIEEQIKSVSSKATKINLDVWGNEVPTTAELPKQNKSLNQSVDLKADFDFLPLKEQAKLVMQQVEQLIPVITKVRDTVRTTVNDSSSLVYKMIDTTKNLGAAFGYINSEIRSKMSNIKTSIETLFKNISSLVKSKMQPIVSIASNVGKMTVGAFNMSIGNIKEKIDEIGKTNFGNVLKSAFQKASNASKSLIDRIRSVGKEAKKSKNNSGGLGESIAKSLSNGLKSIKLFTLALLGIRTAFRAVSKAAQAYLSFDQSLSNSIQNSWNMLGSLLAPALEYVASLFSKVTNAIAQFVKMLTGIDLVAKANTKALNKQTGATKKLSEAQSSLDEFHTINKDSSGGSGTDTPQIKVEPVDMSWLDTLKNKLFEIKTIFESIWNTPLVQSFVEMISVQFDFLKNLAIQLGTDLWNNLSMTWINIEENVRTTLTNISTLFTMMFTDIANGITTWGEPIIQGISGVFNSIWIGVIDPFIQLVSKMWADFSGNLVKLWSKYGAPLVNDIMEFVNTTIGLFQKIWDNVLEPIITPFLEMLSWLWDNCINGLINDVIEFVLKLATNALEIYNKFIAPIVGFLLDVLAPAFGFIGSFIAGTMGTILSTIGNIVRGIIKTLGGIVDFIGGVFTGNWKKAWNGVKSIFKGVCDSLTAIFKAPINFIIDMINGFIGGLNKIKIPDWVPAIGGKGIDIPKIPKLANGGVLDRETIVKVAEYSNARSNPEIVSPRDMMKDTMIEAIQETGYNRQDTQKVEVDITGELRASGNDLVLVYDKTKNDKGYDGINNPSFAY